MNDKQMWSGRAVPMDRDPKSTCFCSLHSPLPTKNVLEIPERKQPLQNEPHTRVREQVGLRSIAPWGTWLAQLVERRTLDLGVVVSSTPTLGVEII